MDQVDQALRFSIEVEGKLTMEDVLNFDDLKQTILNQLTLLRDDPIGLKHPLIYHLDVSAMYPNIILTNRLQPDAIVEESTCAGCDFNEGPDSECQRRLDWLWRSEYFPAKKNEIQMIKNQLSSESFGDKGDIAKRFVNLSQDEQNILIKKRASEYSRKIYGRIHETALIEKEAIVCQRENPFYIDTVKTFRDRRYEYKASHKFYKERLESAKKEGDLIGADEAQKLVIIYDSLQLAHKCILNSFYGYVMRKGARWYSMEMAGIVCYTGSKIIQLARKIVGMV